MVKPTTVSFKVTQASLNQTALDWPQNMANHDNSIDNMDYNLRGLYERLSDQGWDGVLGAVGKDIPIKVSRIMLRRHL